MSVFTICCDDFVTREVHVGQAPWALVCTGAGSSSGDRPQTDKVHDVIDVPLCCHQDVCVKNTNQFTVIKLNLLTPQPVVW